MIESETVTSQQALAAHGKSFHWAWHFLGKQTGKNAARLYQFCRVLDDMADGDVADGPKRLKSIRRDLVDRRRPDDALLAKFIPLIEDTALPVDAVIALIDGLLSDQKKNVTLTDETMLLRYAYQVAGTVGLMMSRILGCHDRRALAHAIDLGIAMQLTNIARDVLEDAEMGRRYLPETWVGRLTPRRIVALSGDPAHDEAVRVTAAVERLIRLADEYYKSGLAGCYYLPFRAHLSIAVAAIVYRQIGVQLAWRGFAWFAGRQVTSTPVKIICSVRALSTLAYRLKKPPSHNPRLHDELRKCADVILPG